MAGKAGSNQSLSIIDDANLPANNISTGHAFPRSISISRGTKLK